jgi:hypothetical protein
LLAAVPQIGEVLRCNLSFDAEHTRTAESVEPSRADDKPLEATGTGQ